MSSAILSWLVFLPTIGTLTVLALPGNRGRWIRQTALGFAVVTFLLSVLAAWNFNWMGNGLGTGNGAGGYGSNVQLTTNVMWIASLNVHYFVGLDGLSMPFVLLTTAIWVLACLASFGVEKHLKGYFALFLFLETGMLGVFSALDLLLFYVFFEISLFPMYFLIGIWGGPKREYAAIKFFLYTLLGSVAILIVILGIYHYTAARGAGVAGGEGGPCFDLIKLASPEVNGSFTTGEAGKFAAVAFWLLFVGFAVKVPTVPLHTWLPDAHVEAPTPISMVLAAVLLKMGGYGFLRISYPLFAHEAAVNWRWVALIGVVSILYGALCALAQRDFKRLVAYSSISHMGYVMLGLAVMTPMGLNGAMFQMIAHGITSAMMFFIVGVIYDRAHHREIPKLGGFWAQMPTYTGWAAVGFFASLGLPGLCGFVGELLVLLGVFSAASPGSIIMTTGGANVHEIIVFGVLAAAAVVLTAGYLLWTLQRVYMGRPRAEYSHFAPISGREKLILATFGLAALAWGILPNQLLLGPIRATMDGVMRLMGGT